MRRGIEVVIMCKAPVPGRVKTRLQTRFSADQAARIHAAMATTVIRRAARLFASVRIAADDLHHPFFHSFRLPLVAQGEGDLGARMARLARQVFSGGADSALFLGTDSPHMPDARLIQAADGLFRADVVIGPVEDGGYDLLGMNGDWPVFEGVAWSSNKVLRQTLDHCQRLGLSWLLLETGFDIDTPADLDRAAAAGWHCPI